MTCGRTTQESPRIPPAIQQKRSQDRVAIELTLWPLNDALGRPLAEVFQILNEDTNAAVASPEVRDRLATAGGEPGFLGHAAFKAFLKDDAEHWQQIVRLIKP